MKIGLDLRFLGDDLYSSFIIQLTRGLVNKSSQNTFVIYCNSNLEGFNYENVIFKKVNINNFSLNEQTKYLKILNNDNNNLMIFFNHYKPIFYKGVYFTILLGLKDIYYNTFSNYLNKYSFLYLLEKNLNKSHKILCFDLNTSNELTEKFNIKEEKINLLPGFFPTLDKVKDLSEININILTKYNINNSYFIYSGGNGIEKNYEKLICVFEKLRKNNTKVDLIILGDEISNNINLRNIVIKLNMQKNIHFMGVIKESEKKLLYKESLGVIFPSLYESFPFNLTEAIYSNSPILASNIKNIKNIFNDSVKYFSPIYTNNIYKNLLEFIENKKEDINYIEVLNKYNKENTIKRLIEIIE